MNIGIAYDLKPDEPPIGKPDDWHEEFDSPATIHALAEALRSLGHTVVELGNGRTLIEALLRHPVDLVFNIAEGEGTSRSREARVPALCEMLNIPCTGSDPLALAVALDKDLTRRIVAESGVVVPKGIVLELPTETYDGDHAEFPPMLQEAGLSYPVIAKPTIEGSSKGIGNRCLIETPEQLGPLIVELWQDYQQAVLIEEFIDGDEVTVGILGNDPPQILGIMEIRLKELVRPFAYTVEVKRDFKQLIDYECPSSLPMNVQREIEQSALTVFAMLGCRDVARLDYRIRDGVPYFLEINPLPGLHPESSDLVIMAKLIDVSHAELVERIIDTVLERMASGGR